MKQGVAFLVVCIVAVATGAWGAQHDPSAVRSLLNDLKGPDFERASSAAEALRNFRGARAQTVPALIQALNTEWSRCSGDVRDAIAGSLAALTAKEAVVPLLRLLGSGKSVGHDCAECGNCFLALTPAETLGHRGFDPFSAEAVMYLGELADAGARELLLGRLRDDDVGVRACAMYALGQIGDAAVVPVLRQAFEDSKEMHSPHGFDLRETLDQALKSVEQRRR